MVFTLLCLDVWILGAPHSSSPHPHPPDFWRSILVSIVSTPMTLAALRLGMLWREGPGSLGWVGSERLEWRENLSPRRMICGCAGLILQLPSSCLMIPEQSHLISHLTLYLAGNTPRAPSPLSFLFFFVFLVCLQRRTLYRYRRYLSFISRLGVDFYPFQNLVLTSALSGTCNELQAEKTNWMQCIHNAVSFSIRAWVCFWLSLS